MTILPNIYVSAFLCPFECCYLCNMQTSVSDVLHMSSLFYIPCMEVISYYFSSQSCTGCESPPDSLILPPLDLDFHEIDLSMVLREDAKQDKHTTAETAFPLSPPSSDNEQKDNQSAGT